MSYDINYQDERFQQVESDKKAALSELNKTYDGMVQESDKYYQAQVDASKQWQQTQTQLQKEQTDFAIDQIEQQKQQAQKDYTREQSGAYTDWQKQSNPYGARAEQLADQGMQSTGYAESSQVAMYTAYQNRVATARESYNRAVMNYNNSITQARLQNNAALAEIAHQALQAQLELSLQGFQYKNTLLLEKANRKTELDQMYHSRWQDVLAQMNTENALAEQVRQFNAQLAEEQRQFNMLHSPQTTVVYRKSDDDDDDPNPDLTIDDPNDQDPTFAVDYLNALIRNGAQKDQVSNEIAIALRNGQITKAEAAELRKTFTPRGQQY